MSWTLGALNTVLCLIAGIAVGAVYFAGLWLTLQKVKTVRHYGRLLFLSWLGRSAFMLATFYVIMQNDWQRLIAAFAGVMAVRIATVAFAKRDGIKGEVVNGKL